MPDAAERRGVCHADTADGAGGGDAVTNVRGVRIVRAGRTHIAQICEIEELSFAVPWSAASFEKEFADGLARYFVAEAVRCGGAACGAACGIPGVEVAGYCGYWHILDEGHITNVAVRPSRRERGIGAGLVRTMLGDMRECGIRAATLEVREDNHDAIRLYERFGFIRAGLRKNYYAAERKNALIYWLEFSAMPRSRSAASVTSNEHQ